MDRRVPINTLTEKKNEWIRDSPVNNHAYEASANATWEIPRLPRLRNMIPAHCTGHEPYKHMRA